MSDKYLCHWVATFNKTSWGIETTALSLLRNLRCFICVSEKLEHPNTLQKIKFSFKDFFSKCDQIRSYAVKCSNNIYYSWETHFHRKYQNAIRVITCSLKININHWQKIFVLGFWTVLQKQGNLLKYDIRSKKNTFFVEQHQAVASSEIIPVK